MEPGAAQVSHALGLDLGGVVLDGRYQVIRRIGAGGMASVYEARRLGLERRFAVKILRPELAENESNIKRFLREARAAAAVQHPNVVSIEDVGSATPPVYFVMEYLEGHDLRYELKRVGRIEWGRAQDMVLQIVDALSAAHNLGIIHRDVKPANCFLVRDPTGSERLKVLDFGIAKVLEESQEFTQNVTATHGIVGTVAYMAPEQARSSTVDARTDVYALGTMLYEMLAGTVPFPDKNPFVVIGRLLGEAAVPLRMHRPDLPSELDAIVMTCLEKDPDARFQSMDALGVALSNCEVAGVVGTARVRLPSGLVRAATNKPKVTAARMPANADDDAPTSAGRSSSQQSPQSRSGATAPSMRTGGSAASSPSTTGPSGSSMSAVRPRRSRSATDSALVGLLVGGIGMVGIGGTATWWALRDHGTAPSRAAQPEDTIEPTAEPAQMPGIAPTTPTAGPMTAVPMFVPIPGPAIAVPVPATIEEPLVPDATRPTSSKRPKQTPTQPTTVVPPTQPTTEPTPQVVKPDDPQPKISPDLRNPFTPKK